VTVPIISREGPTDWQEWNRLAEENGSLVQSTYYDEVERFFGEVPVYLEWRVEGRLCAGAKLYVGSNRRLGTFSSRLSLRLRQFGEFLVTEGVSQEVTMASARDALEAAVDQYSSERGIVWFESMGYYGGVNRLLRLGHESPFQVARFNVGRLDLTKPLDALWAGLHPAHRGEVRKAERARLNISESVNIEELIHLLGATYEQNPRKMPEPSYLRHLFGVLRTRGLARIFVVREDRRPLASALLTGLGGTVYYAFAGNERNSLGAGQFLQWEVIRRLKEEGISFYVMGQVASEVDQQNLKFSIGISRFKRRFGLSEEPSQSARYVRKPALYRTWHALLRVYRASFPRDPGRR